MGCTNRNTSSDGDQNESHDERVDGHGTASPAHHEHQSETADCDPKHRHEKRHHEILPVAQSMQQTIPSRACMNFLHVA